MKKLENHFNCIFTDLPNKVAEVSVHQMRSHFNIEGVAATSKQDFEELKSLVQQSMKKGRLFMLSQL